MKRSLWKPAACALIALAAASAARADLYIPTKTADTDDGACTLTDCSLREAIDAANDHAGADAILLRAGTYLLTLPASPEGHLAVRGDLTLVGDGAGRSIIDGHAASGIFFIAGGVTAEFREVTLKGGKSPGAGGAIHNDGGNLTLIRVEVNGNASVAGSRGAGIGGGISSPAGTLTLRDSFIGFNSAENSGGGLYAGGTVTIANVTFDNNKSLDGGGGLYFAASARVTVNNATITRNTAPQGGGIYIQNTPFLDLAPRVTNSIVAENLASGDGSDCFGPINSSYDVIGNPAGCVGPSAATHDLIGAAAQPLNLANLAFNGGPTVTRALTAGSKALDAGNPAAPGSGNGACEATDQRGATRPGGPRCDIGAFELTAECLSGGGTLCLNQSRFKVTATWQTATGTGAAIGVPLTSDSGYFYFFDPTNVEVTVKVLDACIVNNKYWVFVSGLTNLGVTLNVTDTRTNVTKTYANPRGRTFRTILDSSAFPCP
ncbi:MAG: choice-of-anchor Q domain-containing protein [Thermoanaerobaculia bacterium]